MKFFYTCIYQEEGGRNTSKSIKLLLSNIKGKKKTQHKHIKARILKILDNVRFLLCMDHGGQVVSFAHHGRSANITQAVPASQHC